MGLISRVSSRTYRCGMKGIDSYFSKPKQKQIVSKPEPKKSSKKNVIESDSDSDNAENVAPSPKLKTAYNKPSSSTVTKISTSDFFGGLKTKKRKTPKDVTKVVTPKKKRSLESTEVVQQPNKKQKVV